MAGPGPRSDAPVGCTGRPSRRQRTHDDTVQAIVGIARGQLSTGNGLSLRGVAAEMGMTAAGLYRYVDTVHDLHRLVADTITDDLLDHLVRVPAVRETDPAVRWAMFCVHLRAWVYMAPAEALLVVAGPSIPRGTAQFSRKPDAPARAPLRRIREAFEDLLAPLVDDTKRQAVAAAGGRSGVARVVEDAWVRLCGFLTMETLGNLDAAPAHGCLLFRDTMRDITQSVGLARQWPRLLARAEPVMAGLPSNVESSLLTHPGGSRA